jgi:hypothetical protein
MRKSSVALFGLVLSVLINFNIAHAAPYVVTQSQSFALYPPNSRLINEAGQFYRYDWENLEFYGTAGSIIIGGEAAALTRVSFSLVSKLDYGFTVGCRDEWYSDCYTQGAYAIYHDWRTDESMFPMFEGFNRIVHFASRASVQAHDSGGPFSAEDIEYERVLAEPEHSFSLSAKDYDLSFLDIDNYLVTVKRSLYLYMLDLDTNDYLNVVSIHHYSWEGNLTITYEYEYEPTPAPVPEPRIILLVASGLIALTGLRRTVRRN